MNHVSNKLKELGATTYLHMFKYINTISPKINDLCLAKKAILRVCKSRYCESFIEGYIIKECNDNNC